MNLNDKDNMKKILLFVFISSCHIIVAQKQYDNVLNYYHQQKNFNGVAIFATNGKIDYINAIGIADRKQNKKMNKEARFKIASMTKAFTAVLIMQLYEEGKLKLDIPFKKYYANYEGLAKDKVTVDHLLTYSSGIPDGTESLGMQPYKSKLNLQEFIDQYCSNSNLKFEPGTKSEYSNIDYMILHKIIENITQKTYSQLLQEKILTPLGMKHTQLLNSSDLIPNLVTNYTIDDSLKSIGIDESYLIANFFGAGAMYSTAEDMLKFDQGIFNYKLLNKENTEKLLAPHEELNGVAYGVWYAGGWGTFDKPFIYRTGGILGACSNWIYTIEDKKSIILLNNTNGTNLYEMSEQLYLMNKGQKASIEEINKQN
jgi:teichoic acid D-alanine hydrolase